MPISERLTNAINGMRTDIETARMLIRHGKLDEADEQLETALELLTNAQAAEHERG